MGRLDGKSAIVTGGAVGRGAAYVRALVAEGAAVLIADIADGSALVDESDGPVLAMTTDVSRERDVRDAVARAMDAFGRIDILVNNAAIYSALDARPLTAIDVELWDRIIAVNVRGPFLMAKHVLPAMIEQGAGKIINIASGVAYKGLPGLSHYATSKAALLGLTRSLSREVGDQGICVNTLAPGLVLSDSILANEAHIAAYSERVKASRAIRRDGLPADLIGALLFLASADSDFVTGQTLVVDGGSINI